LINPLPPIHSAKTEPKQLKNKNLIKIKTPKAPLLIRPNLKNKIYAAGRMVFNAGSSLLRALDA
jgi:hypothetical protein